VAIRRKPVLRWNSASAVLDSDPSGNRKWDKRKATGRIDGMVAATMAMGAAGGHVEATPVSIWDRPDMVLLPG
jgi:phage terminase large subunit-like protein